MTIGELSRRSGVSRDTIRYYERLGLLACDGRRGAYKDYGEEALTRLHRIRYAKGLGFRLTQIASMLPGWIAGSVSDDVRISALLDKLREVEAERHRLDQIAQALRAQLQGLECPPRGPSAHLMLESM